jgi:hypothetical protein
MRCDDDACAGISGIEASLLAAMLQLHWDDILAPVNFAMVRTLPAAAARWVQLSGGARDARRHVSLRRRRCTRACWSTRDALEEVRGACRVQRAHALVPCGRLW